MAKDPVARFQTFADLSEGLVATAGPEVTGTGQGQAILLRGPAGIGKTRLAEEVLREGRDVGFAIHRCLVLDFGSTQRVSAITVYMGYLDRDDGEVWVFDDDDNPIASWKIGTATWRR